MTDTKNKPFKYSPQIDGRKLYSFAKLTKEEFYKEWAHKSSGEILHSLCASNEQNVRAIARTMVSAKLNEISELSGNHLPLRHCTARLIKKMLYEMKSEELKIPDLIEAVEEDRKYYELNMKELGLEPQPLSEPLVFYSVLKEDYQIDLTMVMNSPIDDCNEDW